MNSNIKGITIEIGGNTTKLQQALKDVNRESRDLSTELRQVERLLRLDPGNATLAAQRMQILGEQSENAAERLRILSDAQEEVNQQFQRGEIDESQYNAFNREVERAQANLDQLRNAAQEADNEVEDLGEEAEKTGGKFDGLGAKVGEFTAKAGGMAIKGTVAAMAAIGTAAVSAGAMAVSAADEAQKAFNAFQVQTGTSALEMEGFKDSITEIYRNNFGESFEDIANSMAILAQQTNLTGKELENATTNAIMLRDTFGFEVLESTRAVNQMMKNFGVTADEAYNLIAQGAQNGLNANDDLLDTINEYSVHFQQLGFSSEEMFNMLENGAESGTFSIDKLGDAIKEFGIRSKDNSDATVGAFLALGLNADEVTKKFSEGGAKGKEAFDQVTQALFEMDDKTKQNSIGVALFGTMWEDLGAEGVKALTSVQGEFDKTALTMEQIGKIKYNDLESAIGGIGRVLQTDVLMPLGQEALPLLNDFANALKDGFTDEGIKNLSKSVSEFATEITGMIGEMLPGLLEIGTSLLNSIVATIAEMVPVLLPQLTDAAFQLIDGIIQAISDNADAFADTATVLIVGFLEFFSKELPKLFEVGIKIVLALVESLTEKLPELIPVMVEGILNLVTVILDNLPAFIDAAIEIILAVTNGIIEALPQLLEKAPEIIQKLVLALIDAAPELATAALEIIVAITMALIENLPLIIQAAIEIMYALMSGMISIVPEIIDAVADLVNKIDKKVREFDWKELGMNLLRGIANGIKNGVSMVVEEARKMANSVWKSITSVFEIQSPSKLAIRTFQKDFAEEGIGAGILKGIPKVVGDAEKLSNSVMDALNTDISMNANVAGGGIVRGGLNSASVGGSVATYNININNPVVRNDSDIKKISQDIYKTIFTNNRALGVV